MENKLSFNILDWNFKDDIDEDEEDDDETSKFVIECFGKTQDDKSLYLKINGFTPFFFVEIPKKWNEYHVNKFLNYIKNKTYGRFKNSILAYDVQKKKNYMVLLLEKDLSF